MTWRSFAATVCTALFLTLGAAYVAHVLASDEYLATASPITDLTSGTNAGLVIDIGQNGPRERYTLSGNVTVTSILNARSGISYRIYFKQDATGSRTVSWPSNIKWAGGSAPTMTTGAGKQDYVELTWDGLNASWFGTVTQNF